MEKFVDVNLCDHQFAVWGKGHYPIALNLTEDQAEEVIAEHPEEYYAECDMCGKHLNA